MLTYELWVKKRSDFPKKFSNTLSVPSLSSLRNHLNTELLLGLLFGRISALKFWPCIKHALQILKNQNF